MIGTVMFTLQRLQSICTTKQGKARATTFYPYLDQFMPDFCIDTAPRIAAFIAQAMHESGEFLYMRELGSNAYLDKYDTGPLAKRLGNTPIDDDDGQKYCGRGIFQITGLTNYATCGRALHMDLLADPQLLELPEFAVKSACWFWHDRGLNELADAWDFRGITRKINGGYTGLESRIVYWERARKALGLS